MKTRMIRHRHSRPSYRAGSRIQASTLAMPVGLAILLAGMGGTTLANAQSSARPVPSRSAATVSDTAAPLKLAPSMLLSTQSIRATTPVDAARADAVLRSRERVSGSPEAELQSGDAGTFEAATPAFAMRPAPVPPYVLNDVLRRSVAVRVTGGGATDTPESLVKLALERNPALAGQKQAIEAGISQLREAVANGSPTFALAARASVAEGGRTFEIPTGDALNPVYRNLEELNRRNLVNAPPYPTLQNQTLSLLRPTEQETKIVFTAPLYVPSLDPRIRAAGASAIATSAQMESVARHLVRDVKVAWHGMRQALAQKAVFESSAELLAENVRVHEVLLQEGKVTRDALLRARAEWLAVLQAVTEAQFQADSAARRLNVLTARPLETEIRTRVDESAFELAMPVLPADVKQALADYQAPPELRQIAAGLQARKSLEEAARKNSRPTVGVAVEAGYQGRDYNTGPGTGVAIASLVLNWKFADGGVRDAQLGAATAQRRQLELQEIDAKAQLEGVLRTAGERLSLARQQVENARARQTAAEESFRIATRKREAGNLSQLEYFDAQRTLTDARSAGVAAIAQLNVALAEFELAKSSYPLPAQWRQMSEEALKK